MCVAEIRVAPGGRNFIKPSPTTGCCEHTHVCCRLNHLRVAPKDQGLQGSPDQLLLRPYTCVLQNKSNQGCTQGSNILPGFGRPDAAASISTQSCTEGQGLRRFGRPNSARSIHMCVAEQTNSGLQPRVEGCKGLADQLFL